MSNNPRLKIFFYKSKLAKEPVREWLKSLSAKDKKIIGEDIKSIQFAWLIGMPMVRKIDKNLWEVRSNLNKRIARIIFTIDENFMVLLHGFIKKSTKIPKNDLELARTRLAILKGK